MTSQDQNIDNNSLQDSQAQQVQAERDAVSFQNSDDNRVTIYNIFLRIFSKSEPPQVDWEWGQRLLKKQLPEIRGRLIDTLGHGRILMDVSLKEQQSWVNRSPLEANQTLQIKGKNCGTLDADGLLIETFGRDDIAKKLLILGAPGAGKTTALLSLAEQLMIGAMNRPKTVIPVLVELSTWRDDNQSIHDWLIEQLYDLHGGKRKRYKQWLEQEVLLPLLDGLDELGLERQKKCTVKLDEFARDYPQVVICCRTKEFETANLKLKNLNGAVCLQPLSDSQIQNYLHNLNRPLWSAIQTNPDLQNLLKPTPDDEPCLLRLPLFIKLAANVYTPEHPIYNKVDLLETYVNHQLSLNKRSQDRSKGLEQRKWAYKAVESELPWRETHRILNWLAQQLLANDKVELLIEQMQPSWIESAHLQRRYRLILRLILMSIFVLTFVLNTWLYSMVSDLLGTVLCGLVNGGMILCLFILIVPFTIHVFRITRLYFLLAAFLYLLNNIQPVEVFQIPSLFPVIQKKIESLKIITVIYWLILAVIIGLLIGIFNFLIPEFSNSETSFRAKLIHWIYNGLISGLIVAPGGGLVFLILQLIDESKQELKVRLRPNQGIWNSFQNMLGMTLFTMFPLIVGSLLLQVRVLEDV